MNMQEFYDFHGISRLTFSKMIGIPYQALMHYEIGHHIKKEYRIRIEIGVQIMEDYAIRYDRHILKMANNATNDIVWYCPHGELARQLAYEKEYLDNIFKRYFEELIKVEL